MKHFIYFDKDKIESLVAQSYGGIEESIKSIHEKTKVDESNKSNSVKVDVNGSLNAIVKKLKVSVGGEHTSETRNSVNELLGEIHTKILHDSIFDILVSDLEDSNKFHPSEKKTGSFIKDEDELQIIDFEYLESFFKENSVAQFIIDSREKELRGMAEKELKEIKSNESISNHQKQKSEKEVNEKLTENLSELEKQSELYDYLGKMIAATKSLLPYNRMALSLNGYLIPLEEKYFRDNPNLFGLKYGGSFHYVGYITNILEENPKTEDKNVFGQIQKAANEFLFRILPTDANKIYILHPLGIYFES